MNNFLQNFKIYLFEKFGLKRKPSINELYTVKNKRNNSCHMNKDQVDIILQYLKIETNYAVIINGPYGVGKTYFFKKVLSPEIEKTSVLEDKSKKFNAIHISLFGLKTLEEIQTAIFVELYPILKKKGLKLASGVGKSIIRGIVQIGQAGDIDKYIADINSGINGWLDYQQLVICFDDLDRRSESLDLRDVFGFINSMVENEGAKILIISNEKKLLEDENYTSDLREKVIGVSVQFTADTENTTTQIIDTRYKNSSVKFRDFLIDNSSQIIEAVQANQSNFRNLIFFLEHFKTIYHPLTLALNEGEFKIYKDEKIKAVLDFTLAITIEYKMGFLNSTNFDELINSNQDTFSSFDFKLLHSIDNEEKDKKPKPYLEIFREKYYKHKKFYFFKSIFDYIVGIGFFDIKTLTNELEAYFYSAGNHKTEEEKILDKLSYLDCLNLSDDEYKKLTEEMLDFVDEGKYQLRQYADIFHFAIRFDNLLDFKIDHLKERFKRGIKKGIPNYSYESHLDFHMSVSSGVEFKDEMDEMVSFCLEINDQLKNKNYEEKVKKLFSNFKTDYNSFIEKVNDKNNEIIYKPFWSDFDFDEVFTIIKNLENKQIWDLSHYFKSRYRKEIFRALYPEKEFILELKKNINETKDKEKNLKNASLNFLSKSLEESLSNFSN